MRIRAAVVASLLLAAPLLAACSSDTTADPQACKAAMAEGYRKAMAEGGKGPDQKRPAACKGVDDKTAQRLAGEVVKEYLDSDQAKKDVNKAFEDSIEQQASATPSPSTSVSPECQAWIKKELQDSSESVDGKTGVAACGDLSDDELQAAIDQVTKELSAG
ncbi:hypothetical protein [Streptomyces diastatochromogenes]|uniref:hypothetical protein n=1 Tax=Streptomyces diastatochromogenes TaxID=42236 RepID=UPI0036BEAB16